MVDRINQAADFVAKGTGQSKEQALKQLSISPQCGLASHAESKPMSYEEMVAKLKLIRSIANEVWPGEE